MGCDIHLFTEQKIDGVWKSVDVWKDEYNEGRLSVPYEKSAYHSRNYSLFAILADVRNGRGFAGIKTGEGFTPIAEPKGLPKDVSSEVAASSDNWGADGHSHSWLTIREILDFDWNQKTTLCGWVDAENFREWKSRGQPESWCGGIGGPGIKHVDCEEMQRLIDVAEKPRTSPS